MTVDQFIVLFWQLILEPVIALLFGAGLLVFGYGVVVFIKNSDSDEERKKGGRHMFWGVIGMTIMASAFGIFNLIENTIYQGENPPYRDSTFPSNISP